MFRNLDAEQARKGYTNSDVANRLGISRVSYENKKKTGKFTTFEIKQLCKIFKCKFYYLFATEQEAWGGEWNMGDTLLQFVQAVCLILILKKLNKR